MKASSLISDCIEPLRLKDTGGYAVDLMNEFHLKHLPLVDGKQLLGLVSEDDVLDHDLDAAISSYGLRFNQLYLSGKNHIYEILRLMADFRLSAIPVVNQADEYLGVITQEDVLVRLGGMGSFTVPGSIMVLEMNRKDYSLAHVSGIIEQENAAILSTFITSDFKSSETEVTLKINKRDVSPIVNSLERHGFKVRAFFHESDFLNEMVKERYDSLMHFLNV